MRPWIIFLLFTSASFGQITTPIKNPKLTGAADFDSITNKSTVRTHLGAQTFDQDLTDFAAAASWNGLELTLSGVGLILDQVEAVGFTGSGAGLDTLNASNISTGTLAYARGGTNATSQATARANLGGTRIAANLASLTSSDMSGQVGVSLDGGFGIDFNGDGSFTDNVVLLPEILYFKGLSRGGFDGNVSLGHIAALGAGGTPHTLEMSSTSDADLVLLLRNHDTEFHSAITLARSTDPSPGTAAFAIGNADSSLHYRNRLFIATNPPINDVDGVCPPIAFYHESNDIEGYTAHKRLEILPSDKTVKIYGWTSGVVEGPTALTVSEDATVSVGVKLTIPTSPPASAGAAGVAGTVTWDANFVYICVATNTWKRAAISTW